MKQNCWGRRAIAKETSPFHGSRRGEWYSPLKSKILQAQNFDNTVISENYFTS
ncbi:hypothetical protein [Okeania sp. KiyG1]|uniref:hypothetical protein n=1 Tax=Okeania sp. KiyG1 TaxID=2720165 RepID=UPI0013C1D4F6|nr:hypothetical protein [Okeania sp. KiyG1]NEQ76858.1 hypothetical protein [Okeania sp. SIO2C9]